MKLILSLAAMLLFVAQPVYAGNGGKLPFEHDYNKGLANAKMFGKPAVLYFTADW